MMNLTRFVDLNVGLAVDLNVITGNLQIGVQKQNYSILNFRIPTLNEGIVSVSF